MPVMLVVVVLLIAVGIAVTFVIGRHRSGDRFESSMRDFATTQAAIANVTRVGDMAA